MNFVIAFAICGVVWMLYCIGETLEKICNALEDKKGGAE